VLKDGGRIAGRRFDLSSVEPTLTSFPSLVLIFSCCLAQKTPEPREVAPAPSFEGNPFAEEFADPVSRIVGRAILQNRAFERLDHLCTKIGGRLTGSENAEKAVDWCIATMKADGFDDARGEKVIVPVWVRGEEVVSMTAPQSMKLAACALGGSIGTLEGPIEAAVVEVEDIAGIRKLARDQVEGRIVYFNRRMQRDNPEFGYGVTVQNRSRGAIEAAMKGAVACAIRAVGTDEMNYPHTGMMGYDRVVPRIPAVAIGSEHADVLHSLLSQNVEVRLSVSLGAHTLPDAESANVVAEIKGREKPEEIVAIGGHLDSWDLGQGAIDDGAGCVIAWEAARLLLELDLRPRRTVRVVLFMNEESGLRGAAAYAETHAEELSRHVAAIESDGGADWPTGFSFGWNHTEGQAAGLVRVQQIGALLQGIGANRVRQGGSGGADLSPIHDVGVPCLGLNQDSSYYFDYHHSPEDTIDKVDPHRLSLNVAAMAAMTYVLAEMETALNSH